MSVRYIADEDVEWRHPTDEPPPKGTKLLLYMYPHGITIIGEFHGSGAKLWAPLPKVPQHLRDRLEKECCSDKTDR